MPPGGVPSEILILPRYRKALFRINTRKRLWILCHFHQADTSVLRARPRKKKIIGGVHRGVFAMRSPDRPNPVSLTLVTLKSCRRGVLRVDRMDAVSGTPVIDIKSCLEIPERPRAKRKRIR